MKENEGDPREKIIIGAHGLRTEIDQNRSVEGYPSKDGTAWILENCGIETRIALSDEALDAMIQIRRALKRDLSGAQ